jgi:hypothetical protein
MLREVGDPPGTLGLVWSAVVGAVVGAPPRPVPTWGDGAPWHRVSSRGADRVVCWSPTTHRTGRLPGSSRRPSAQRGPSSTRPGWSSFRLGHLTMGVQAVAPLSTLPVSALHVPGIPVADQPDRS